MSRLAEVAGELGPDCTIGALAVVFAGATLGRGCVLHPHVTIGGSATRWRSSRAP